MCTKFYIDEIVHSVTLNTFELKSMKSKTIILDYFVSIKNYQILYVVVLKL